MKEIGGYFELETNKKINDFKNYILLNSARNCLRYVIKAYNIQEINIPYYTCPVVWQTIKKENCKINFYHINKDFLPNKEFNKKDYILYTNYFGICAKNIKKLTQQYPNLIIDNAQAFYMKEKGIASFNSIRKFFGVTDGAILYCNKKLNCNFEQDYSYNKMQHLLKRIDKNAQFGYSDFCYNENLFDNKEIKTMSNLTKKLIETIDIKTPKKIRLKNFNYLHSILKNTNELKINLDKDDIPMVYPYLIKNDNLREKLIKNKIFIAQYWSPMPKEYQEGIFQKYIFPLPIDQRYNINDMKYILNFILN